MQCLKKQFKQLVNAAHKRGLRVRRDDRLRQTPYRAMNPSAACILRQPCLARTITYQRSCRRPEHRKVLDVRHEILEHDRIKELQKRGVPRNRLYPLAHRFANRKQANKDSVR